LPIGFNPHRGWSFLTLAVAIMASYGAVELASTLKKHNVEKIIFYSLIVAGILYTSAYHKYNVNTAIWPTHYFSSESDIPGYMWLENLPDNTPVTSLCRGDEKVIGMNMYSTKPWDTEQRDFQGLALNATLDKIYDFVTKKGYQYVVIDSSCVEAFGINKTNDFLTEASKSSRLELVYPNQKDQPMSTFIFKLL
jgi:hypothetical protein